MLCCAVLCCAVLWCGVLQVWKDVDGVLSSDPRIVSAAQPVNELTYEEATELAFFGAQVGMVVFVLPDDSAVCMCL
jgi:aspartate kinase